MSESLITTSISKSQENLFNVNNTDFYIIKDNTKIPLNNIFRNKYRHYILTLTEEVILSDEGLSSYMYQPKKLSLDIYGTIELWDVLLWINDMTSVIQFNKKNIKIISTDKVGELYKILNREEERLLENKFNPTIINSES